MTTFPTAARVDTAGVQAPASHDTRRLRLFSGTSNPDLAREIGAYLGIPDGPRVIKRFADGELYIQIQESIRATGGELAVTKPAEFGRFLQSEITKWGQAVTDAGVQVD